MLIDSMNGTSRRLVLLAVLATLILVGGYRIGAHFFRPLTSDWQLYLSDANGTGPISPRETRKFSPVGEFLVYGSFYFSGPNSSAIVFAPSDCLMRLEINGVLVERRDGEAWCRPNQRIIRSASDLLASGKNTIRANLSSHGDTRGLRIEIRPGGAEKVMVVAGMILLACLWTVLIERMFGLYGVLRYALRSFTALAIVYLAFTSPEVRTYDVWQNGGHADFIRFVARNWALPPLHYGWESHQPPLYYLIAAALYDGITTDQSREPWVVIQVLSLVFFQLYIAVGLRFIRENSAGLTTVVASLAFALWPLNLIHSIRIGNDCLLYLFQLSSFLYLVRWVKDLSIRNLLAAGAFIVAACFTKNTGLAGLATYGIVVSMVLLMEIFARWKHSLPALPSRKAFWTVVLVLFITSAAGLASLTPKILYNHGGELRMFMFPASTAHADLRIPLDRDTFLPWGKLEGSASPFCSPWHNSTGRQNFWLYLYKSAQFGEFRTTKKVGGWFAHVSHLGGLILVVVVIVGAVRLLASGKTAAAWPMVILVGMSLLELIVAVIGDSLASNQDFRYIAYTLLPFSIWLGYGVSSMKRYQQVAVLTMTVVVITSAVVTIGFMAMG